MSASEYAADELTKRQIRVLRNVNTEIKKLLPLLNTMSRDIAKRLTKGNITEFSKTRLKTLKREIDIIISRYVSALSKHLRTDSVSLSSAEARYAASLLSIMSDSKIFQATLKSLRTALTKNKMTLISGKKKQQLTIDEAILVFSRSISKSVQNSVTAGIVEGKTTTEIAREATRVIKTRTKAQAEAMIRTVASHAATMGRQETYFANKEILNGEIFMATLDGHTTFQCAANDQKRFPVGKGPMPPLLYNCRSIRIPDVHEDFIIGGKFDGARPSVSSNGVVIEGGQTTFNSFLRRQPISFQDEYFSQFKDGSKKAKLFRNGKLHIENFVNSNNIEYSIGQLERNFPDNWDRANL